MKKKKKCFTEIDQNIALVIVNVVKPQTKIGEIIDATIVSKYN